MIKAKYVVPEEAVYIISIQYHKVYEAIKGNSGTQKCAFVYKDLLP